MEVEAYLCRLKVNLTKGQRIVHPKPNSLKEVSPGCESPADPPSICGFYYFILSAGDTNVYSYNSYFPLSRHPLKLPLGVHAHPFGGPVVIGGVSGSYSHHHKLMIRWQHESACVCV